MRAFLNAINEIPRAEEHPRGGTAQYRCDLDNIDLGEAVVLNGAGRGCRQRFGAAARR
jgi:hypothetical protein